MCIHVNGISGKKSKLNSILDIEEKELQDWSLENIKAKKNKILKSKKTNRKFKRS